MIADLLGVPEEDHEWFRQELQGGHRRETQGLGSTGSGSLSHTPLEFLYDRLTTYVEERRREPRQDVLTGLATATFPDGSMPEVIDVVRVAANLFSAGQETTVRLLGTALQDDRRTAGHPAAAARGQPAHPGVRRGVPADREPGQGRLPPRPHARPPWEA